MSKPTRSAAIDFDRPPTWPASLRRSAEGLAGAFRGTIAYQDQVRTSESQEQAWRASLAGSAIRCYHATRLLPHEVELVRNQGLRPLSPELISDRISAAFRHGFITSGERELMRDAHVFATGEEAHRDNQVCFFLPRCLLDTDAGSIDPLMSIWGGEGISMSSRGIALPERIQTLGKPAIVVAELDFLREPSTYVSASLLKVAVARLLDIPVLGAQVHWYAPVAPEQIVAVWQPG
ncbi:MAG: hypothetical protein EPO22_09140, partial [Dehalococcoidia bacterium]